MPDPDRASALAEDSPGQPRLLVSVRNVVEAHAAIAGGCDLLDIKEPTRGSLGMADIDTIRDVAEYAPAHIPVSAALGELAVWSGRSDLPALPETLCYVKLGPLCAELRDWRNEWTSVRRRFDARAAGRLNWILVIYADRCQSSDAAADITDFAADQRCAGVLIDTCDKSTGTLVDTALFREFDRIVSDLRAAQVKLAIAGSLSLQTLKQVMSFEPDIIAIRSAACEHGHRDGLVTRRAVASFRSAMTAITGPTSVVPGT